MDRILWILFAVAIAFSLFANTVGFHNSIYDFFGFRQAQTAISAESILHGGSFLHYETPVLGPPWSIPFEFPLYQGVVAGLVKIFSTPLDQTGRFVSIACYFLSFWPLASLLSLLGFKGARKLPALTLFAASPLYAFVTHLFMIESMALLLALLYLEQMFRLVLGARPWLYRHMAVAAVLGMLAGMVKVTTFFPCFAIGLCVAAWGLWREYRSGRFKFSTAAAVAVLCMAVPAVAIEWWTKFADGVKSQNPFGRYLTSKSLHNWNFGTLAERLNLERYDHFAHAPDYHVGSAYLFALLIVVYLLVYRRWSWTVTGCLAAYIGTTLVFFNLHYIHEYYPYSVAVFLVVAAGVMISDILRTARPWLGLSLLVLVMAACGFRYFQRYYPIASVNKPGLPEAAAIVDAHTKPGSVILVTGLDWSSEFPYQSHRRAIMDAALGNDQVRLLKDFSVIEQSIANLGAQNVAAVVACWDERKGDRIRPLLAYTGIPATTNLHADFCDIYLRPASAGAPAER